MSEPFEMVYVEKQALDRLVERANRVESDAERQRRVDDSLLEWQNNEILRLQAQVRELQQALVRSNDLLRSCSSVAERQAGADVNWQALDRALSVELKSQHTLSTAARLSCAADEAISRPRRPTGGEPV